MTRGQSVTPAVRQQDTEYSGPYPVSLFPSSAPPPVPAEPYPAAYSDRSPVSTPLPLDFAEPAARAETEAPERFSYRARISAFVVYLAVFTIISLPLQLLRPLVENWSGVAVLRLNVALSLLLYIPIVGVALYVLRRNAGLEPRPSLRALLAGLGLHSPYPLRDVGLGALAYLMALPLFSVATIISQWLFHRYHTPINPVQMETMLTQNPLDQLLLLAEAALAAPLVEETMFRGLLYPALRTRWGMWGGMAISAAIFALVHPTLPGGFLPLWTLGAVFAYVYERRGSLLPCIVMHGLHNGLLLISLFVTFGK